MNIAALAPEPRQNTQGPDGHSHGGANREKGAKRSKEGEPDESQGPLSKEETLRFSEARTLLGAPGLTRSKRTLLGTQGIATNGAFLCNARPPTSMASNLVVALKKTQKNAIVSLQQ